ncbi:hypothetical protein [Parapedobacter soli]|uniref:hypothetical protein n=1 Tax=Parapedobacter soli TaxID=416955 RepID=UPI0021C7C08A|nr:hypothetical protein [Parapedobacter soli]
MKTIHPVLVFSLIFAVGFLASCKKIKEVLKADFDYEAAPITVTIPAVPVVLGDIELTKEVAMDLDAIIQQNAPLVSANNVREINLTGIIIEVADPDEDNNLQNPGTIRVAVGADGVEEKVIAEIANNPDVYETSLSLPVTDGAVDLKPYIMKGKFDYKLYAKPRRGTTKSLTVTVKTFYTFVVGV